MSEFDKWYEENSWDIENYYDAEKAFKAGQQSQQTKIDELQARIDEALYHLDFNHDNDKDIAISILKGNKDEN